MAYAQLAISLKDNPALGGYTGENAVWKACKDVPTGKWDAQIDMIAASMKNRPTIKFLVRIDYEVSLNMFANKTNTPFIDILNKYTALGINPLEKADQIAEFDLQAYKDAYNYIAQRIRVYNQVTNAAFVFHPVRGINDAKMLYPGDANVDWFGLSIFNHDVCWPTWEGAVPPFRNCPEAQAMDDNVRQCMEWAKNTIKKPIIIAESAAQSDLVNQNSAAFQNGYLDKVFNLITTYDIKAFVYINSNWTSHGWSSQWGDSRVEKRPEILSHWLTEVSKPRYIHYPQVAPVNDCAGVSGGTAKTDVCGVCVGGTTGKITLDTDNDGTADCVDTDDDNDGIVDADDCAPLNAAIKGKTLWYADTDVDGFGDPAVSQLACTNPAGYVADKTDVCPNDPKKKVAGNCGCGKTEQSCLDCNNTPNGIAKVDACGICVGGTTGRATLDTDNDGTADCADTDDDNDGVLDADDCAPLNAAIKGKTLWYADTDGDGFGDTAVSQLACTKPSGYVADKTDACPADSNKKAAGSCGCGKTEQSCLDCAGVVNGTATLDNCQVCVGGTTGKTTLDTDNDGTADCVDTDDDNDGVADADDCDSVNAAIKGKTLWYADTDGDGFGDPAVSQLACTKPPGYVADKTDACPADSNKKAAGNCGCGKTEQSCLDCAGVANGTATLDNCQVCVGGTTGLEECIKDCHGDWGGTAVIDVCNQCAGGNTGIAVKTNVSQCITTGTHTSNSVSITVVPQPFESFTTIETNNAEITALTIVDATGNIVFQKSGLQEIKIEVGETLSNGIYTALIQTESGISVIKILKLK